MASDEAREIEAEAIEKTKIKDWLGARERFLKVLEHDLLPLERAKTLANIANTYQGEHNHREAIRIARQSLEILETPEHSDRALRDFIVRTIVRSGGSINITPSWLYTLLSFLYGAFTGAYLGYYVGTHIGTSSYSLGNIIKFCAVTMSSAAIAIWYMSYSEARGVKPLTLSTAIYFGSRYISGLSLLFFITFGICYFNSTWRL